MQCALGNSAAFIESVIAAWCQCIDSNLYALFVFLQYILTVTQINGVLGKVPQIESNQDYCYK